ncbi:exportin-T isoform X3 [Raphanus sativus]|uniref:Exportin-T n=1 Tax=Raphanus sativus TaxID=3726 RepID=A0A6J0LD04_RAPSA|nr:exportin-T isoform X3 [Raphanus sativus]
MDDLENAILISFESGPVEASLKSHAVSYCQQIKETPDVFRICIHKLWFCNLVQVQFWCLQTLQDVLRVRYGSMSSEERSFVRSSVFSMACLDGVDNNEGLVRVVEGPVFVKNKLAQVLVTLIYFEYPSVWYSVFVDFMRCLSKGGVVIDMFCRVLNGLDDELISLDYPRSPEEIAVAARVKDAMRQQCVPQIAKAWYDIVSMYRNSDPDLCATVLDCMRRFVSWIDINLVANQMFVALLFELILSEGLADQVRGAAAGCVLATVAKRMEPHSKLPLLKELHISRVFGLVVSGDADSELVSEVSALVTGYAVEVLECHKRLNSEETKAVSMDLLNEVLPSVFYVMRNCEVDSTFSIVQFLMGYVSTLKGFPALKEKQLLHINQILEVIRIQICYDPMYRSNLDSLDKIGLEEEDRMSEFRKDLFVLLRTVGRVAPEVTQHFIRNALGNAVKSSSERNVEEVEAALSLLYSLGEAMTEEAMKTGSGCLSELIPMLLTTKFPGHSHRLVALVYLENITRYMKFIQEHSQYIPNVLGAFLDERGLHHQNVHVSRRAYYLFMRVVKLLKSKLVPYIDEILQNLQDTLSQLTTMNFASRGLSGTEDGSHIFEAIGLIIGLEDVPAEKQSDYLSLLLTPLCQQIENGLMEAKVASSENFHAKIANIQFAIVAINALSKGFSERLVTASRPRIGLMFKQTLDMLLRILIEFPKVEPLRSKVISLIHRMVETLGPSVLPYLPRALEQLLADSEQPKEMVGFLVLLNQLICKFGTSLRGILDEVYPVVAYRIFKVIPRGDDSPSRSVTITEEMRELIELQRTLYTFLHVMATHNLSSVFLTPKCEPYYEPMMQLLLNTSCTHKDITVRKACVQIFIRLIEDWCPKPYTEEKVPGFDLKIKTFATNCCFYSVLDKSFDFNDANTGLFSEIIKAQKVMYDKFGDAFLMHLLSGAFPSADRPQDLAEQYRQKLQGNDTGGLKLYYQSLIKNLRLQQNGNHVFR